MWTAPLFACSMFGFVPGSARSLLGLNDGSIGLKYSSDRVAPSVERFAPQLALLLEVLFHFKKWRAPSELAALSSGLAGLVSVALWQCSPRLAPIIRDCAGTRELNATVRVASSVLEGSQPL